MRVIRIVLFCLIGVVIAYTLQQVPLKPGVSRNFFFSQSDPQLAADKAIRRMFGHASLVVVAAEGEIKSPDYLQKIEELTKLLEGVRGVAGVKSLTRGPESVDGAIKSPLWRRLLIFEDLTGSQLLVYVDKELGKKAVDGIIPLLDSFKKEHGLEVHISGVPYLLDRVEHYLLQDLLTFTLLTVGVLVMVTLFVFRSFLTLLGMVASCAFAASTTLLGIYAIGVEIGVLTANLLTVVFVLTCSHLVFLNFAARESKERADWQIAKQAVQHTLGPSFFAMLTTALGFITYAGVDAKPLREFGYSGCIASLASFSAAFLVMPCFLGKHSGRARVLKAGTIANWIVGPVALVATGLMVALALYGAQYLNRLNTDPSLLSYFNPSLKMYEGLEFVDRHGGSSPLLVVIRDSEMQRFDTSGVFDRALALHRKLESHPQVGSLASLPIILAEAKDFPLSSLVRWSWLVDIIEQSSFSGILGFFLTEDRSFSLLFMRMKEGNRILPRGDIIADVHQTIREFDFVPIRTGGVYSLQKQMGQLLQNSLVQSLLWCFPLFTLCGYLVSRNLVVGLLLAFAGSLAPLTVLGLSGFLGLPLDLVSIPSATLISALGVDEMFHLVHEKRRARAPDRVAWTECARSLSSPIVASASILSLGFSALFFSQFPPSVRFGAFLVAGIALSCISALLVLPTLLSWYSRLVVGSRG